MSAEERINSQCPPKQRVEGWGRFPVSQAQVYSVQTESEIFRLLATRQGRQLLGRGAGRAYGDAACNQDNWCLDFTPCNRFLGFDAKRGIVHAEAGVTLEQVIEYFVPRGWFCQSHLVPSIRLWAVRWLVMCTVRVITIWPILSSVCICCWQMGPALLVLPKSVRNCSGPRQAGWD